MQDASGWHWLFKAAPFRCYPPYRIIIAYTRPGDASPGSAPGDLLPQPHESSECIGGQMPEAQENRPRASATCAFCRIICEVEEAAVVFEDDLSLAILDHRPLFPGHCLLVPKAHYETLADLPAALVGPLFQNAQLLERAIEEGLGADGTFVALNNHVSQSVPHMHIHLVPRHRKDGLKGFFWPRQHYQNEAAQQQVQDTLRA